MLDAAADSYPGEEPTSDAEPTPEPDGESPPQVLVRRSIWDLEASQQWHPITLAYARAIAELQGRADDDPTSWNYQSAIHGTAAGPPLAGWNQCQHGSWYFLPWHRLYLSFFERIVRSVVLSQGGPEDWALPYWNYDAGGSANTLPLPFRTETLPDGAPNPLFVANRNASINAGAGLPPEAISASAAMGLSNYTPPPFPGFGGGQTTPRHFFNAFGALEQTPHNVVHVLIGGMMSDPNTAARDPIFWLHHCNIDRLWMEWQSAGNQNPAGPAWLTQIFELFDETGTPQRRPLSDTTDPLGTLGYRYDTVAEERAAVALEAMGETERVAGEPEMVGAADESVTLRGESQSVSVPVDVRAAGSVLEAASAEGADRLYLSVEHVDADATPGQAYGVYLEDPSNPQNRYHVGNLALFGIEKLHEERGDDAPHEQRFVYDITDLARQIGGPQAINELRVTFQPIRLEPGEGRELEATAEPEVVPIRIGRVTLRRG